LGIWGAVGAVFPMVGEQRRWNHRLVNMLDSLEQGRYDDSRLANAAA